MTVRRRLQALRRSPTLRIRTTPPAPGLRRLLDRPSRGGRGTPYVSGDTITTEAADPITTEAADPLITE